jgi:hypothetical protein
MHFRVPAEEDVRGKGRPRGMLLDHTHARLELQKHPHISISHSSVEFIHKTSTILYYKPRLLGGVGC